MCGGVPLTIEYTAAVAQLARRYGLKVHLDGARVFNAAVALGVDVAAVVRDVDSVMFCLSKGLCAPVGSIVCGEKDFIGEARRARKIVGGGMRQAGVIAAAGIVALERMTERLVEDHIRAKRLAEGLEQMPGLGVAPVVSNILYFWLTAEMSKTPEDIVDGLIERGVRILERENGRFRAVVHYWISDEDIERALRALKEVMDE
jgi:threonine aldolase